MYTKENLLVAKTASSTSIKKPLQCIAYYGNRTVATDSFRLLEIPTATNPDGTEDEPLKVPELREASSAKMRKGVKSSVEPIGYDTDIDGNKYKGEEFPEYEKIMPKYSEDEETITVKFNGKLLGEMLIQMAKLNKFGAITMTVSKTPYKAIYLEADYQGKTARGLVMPHNR